MSVQVKTLNTVHPSIDLKRCADIRALYEGGREWHERLSTWLPQHPMEGPTTWEKRKARATYQNVFGGVVDLYPAYIFSAAPQIASEDEYYAALEKDATGTGENWAGLWADVLTDLLLDRRSWVMLTLPRSEEGFADFGAQMDAGALDAKLSRIDCRHVRDFEYGDDGSLLWIIFHDTFSRRADPAEPRRNVHRWTLITSEEVAVYEWIQSDDERPNPSPEDTVEEVDRFLHGFKRNGRASVPVVELDVKKGLWLGEKAYDPVVSLIRGRNDLDWGLYHQAHPLLILSTRTEPGNPTLGAGHYLRLVRDADGMDDAKFVEPAGNGLAALAEDVDRRRTEVFRVAHQMAMSADPDAVQVARSGASKAMDYAMTKIVADHYASMIEEAMNDLLALIQELRDGPTARTEPPTVSGMEARNRPPLETFLNALAMSTDAKMMSSTFRKEAAKAQAQRVLGPEVGEQTMTTIREEIDAQDDDADMRSIFGLPSPGGSGDEDDDEDGGDPAEA